MAQLLKYKVNEADLYSNNKMEMNNCNSETDHADSLHIQMPSNHRKDDEAKTENAKEEKKPEPRVGVFQLFKFANGFDIFLMVIGSVFALCHGTMIPLMIIVFGKVIETFVNNGSFSVFLDSIAEFLTSHNLTKIEVENKPDILKPMCDDLAAFYNNTLTCTSVLDNNADTMFNLISQFTVYMALMGLGVLVFGYAEVTYWMMSAERQTHRIRKKFFSNLLRQNIAWFDTNESTELNTRMTDDINKIHDGIGDKVGIILQSVSTFLSGLIIGFIFGWKLTLVMLSVSPVLMAAAILLNKLTTAATTNELKAYAIAGSIAEEVLGAIRTVAAFGGQKKELDRYAVNLNHAKKQGIKNGLVNGLSLGFLWFILFLVYALGFWYGAKLTRDEPENYNIGTMMTVFFSVFMAAFSLGTAAPHLQTLSVARGAACVIFNMIDQVPPIDSYSEEGIKLENMKGNVEFKNVHFEYPARTDVKILKGLNLKIDQGQTVAIVGSSGCGKSTIVQLIQRFYDPREGSLFIDGVNVKDLNVRWLRHQIGIVSQEPVLFGTTVSENIRYGCDGVTQEDIIEAAKKANAHDFIMKLPEKYDTQVGERGAQLSGGQKQRVAIARALVRNPKILLLDEATSALDTESESIVQDALDKARLGRTTVVIAHRLSTVKMADSIASLNNGVIVERGTHSEMMNLQGIYYNLVMSQTDEKDDTEYMEVENPKMVDFKKRSIHQSARVRSVSETQVKEKKPEEEKVPAAPFTRTIKLNAPEWPFILIGCVASLVIGATQPAFAVIFSEIMGAFQRHPDEQESFISLASLLYVGLALISFVAYLASGYSFGISGEALTYRLRKASFKSMLRQEIAYFDDHKNNVGALTTRLATDASLVKGATGVRLGTFFINISSLGTAVVIAFVYGWKLTLVLLAFFPFIAAAGGIEVRILAGVAGKNKEALEEAGKTALESIENIRTVVSLSKEPMFNEMYVNKLNGPHKAALKKAHLIGAAFGLSQGIVFFAYAACFWYGAELIKSNEMTFVEVMKVIMVVMFGAVSIGQASAFAPDAAKAGVSAQKIFMLLDKEPTIDSESAEGSQPSDYVSRICFRNVKFCYPTRPDVTVLKNFSLVLEPGQTVALVGTSGCGKSTTVQLIERFYDTEQGDVELDNKNIKDLNLSWLRSQMGIVSQEPVLFDRTIADNIAYGDNSRSVPIADIMEAAKAANIHNFISALPEGYNTNCGEKGAQLSGGQKQRIAIARALLRNPKILILDEATSALDTESEKIVQEALDEAQKGRTSIIIAHRLSTVQNADKIVVLDQGKIIEEGNHSSLMAKKGFYYMLHAVQNKQR